MAVAGGVIGGTVLAGGRQQPEEVVKLRDELGELNKRLERQGESLSRAQMNGGDVEAAQARIDETRRRMDEIKARLAAFDAGTAQVGSAAQKAGEQAATAAPAINDTAHALGNLKQAAEGAIVQLQSFQGGGGGEGGGTGGNPMIHKASLGGGTLPAGGGIGDASGLTIKPGASAGWSHPALLEAARGAGAGRVTALNDHYHGGRGAHGRGLAVDMTGDPGAIMARVREQAAQRGLVEGRNYRLIDEYKHPSRRATGGHVHLQFNNRGAADRFGQSGPKMPEGTLPPGYGGGASRAAERMEAAAARLEEISLRSHHTVEVTASPGLSARTKSMRAHGTGPVKTDVGVSMPDAEGGRSI